MKERAAITSRRRLRTSGKVGSGSVRVDPDPAEVVTEPPLHEVTSARLERLTR